MKTFRTTIPTLVIASLLLFAAEAKCEDWQSWHTFDTTYQLSAADKLSVLGEVYTRDDMSDDYVYLLFASYLRDIGNGLSLLGQGYFESVEDGSGDWHSLRSLVAGPVYQVPLGSEWYLKTQLRFFYQISPSQDWDYYRPRFSLARRFDKWAISLEDELRIDLTGDREYDFYRNRLFLTLTRRLNDHLSAGIGYIRQADRIASHWQEFNALHTVLNYNF